jgi:hypothetical protein
MQMIVGTNKIAKNKMDSMMTNNVTVHILFMIASMISEEKRVGAHNLSAKGQTSIVLAIMLGTLTEFTMSNYLVK